MIGFIAGFFFLGETKGRVKDVVNKEDLDRNQLEGATHESGQNLNAPREPSQLSSSNDIDAERQPLVSPTASQSDNLRNRQGFGSTKYGSMTKVPSTDSKSSDFDPKDRKLPRIAIAAIIAYTVLALHSMITEEVYTLYTLTPLVSHGLGWNAFQLSTSLAIMGFVSLVVQFVIYPPLGRRFSAVVLFRISQLVYAIVYVSFPLIRAFAIDKDDTETGGQIPRVQYLVLTSLAIRYTASTFSYTGVLVMVNLSHEVLLDPCPSGGNSERNSLYHSFLITC